MTNQIQTIPSKNHIRVWSLGRYIYLDTQNWYTSERKIALITTPGGWAKIAVWPRTFG